MKREREREMCPSEKPISRINALMISAVLLGREKERKKERVRAE